MGSSLILDMAIGILFLFLLASILCTAFNEAFATLLSKRSKTLEEGLRAMLNDPKKPPKNDGPVKNSNDPTRPGIVERLLAHPLISNLAKDNDNPSYIPSGVFVSAFFNLLFPTDSQSNGPSFSSIRDTVQQIQNPDLKSILTVYVNEAQGDVDKLRASTEKWFNDTMDRVSGWYKRDMHNITLLLSLVVVGGLNIDTLDLGKKLYTNSLLRANIVGAAQNYVANNSAPAPDNSLAIIESADNTQTAALDLKKSKESVDIFPFTTWGDWWKRNQLDTRAYFLKLLGLLITVMAASLGAPFWFDVLSQFVQIRGTGSKPNPPDS